MIQEERYLVLMRHSRRKDEYETEGDDPLAGWEDRVERPHDPPIIDFQLPIQSLQALQEAVPLGIREIKTSPYRRCLQTASVAAEHLLSDLGRITVDPGLSEVMLRARNAFSAPPEADALAHLPLEGIRALFHPSRRDTIFLAQGDPVDSEESPSESMARFQNTVDASVRECSHDVLVVTHGDCLNAVANQRHHIVIEAPECSWLVIRCSDNTICKTSDGLLMITDD